MKWMALLSLKIKMTLVVGLFFLVIGVFANILLNEWHDMQLFSTKELKGTEFYFPTFDLLTHLQRHRGNSLQAAKGVTEANQAAKAAAANVDQALDRLQALEASNAGLIDLGNKLNEIERGWQALNPPPANMSPEAGFQAHSDLIAEVVRYIEFYSDQSNLTLDPEVETFYLMQLLSFTLPVAIEYSAQLRGVAAGAIANGKASSTAIRTLTGLKPIAIDKVEIAISAAEKSNTSINDALQAELNSLKKANSEYNALVEEILNSNRSSLSSSEMFAKGTVLVDAGYNLARAALPHLQALLQQRIDNIKASNRNTILFLSALLLLAVVVSILIIMALIKSLNQANRLLAEIQNDNLDNIIHIVGTDEMATLLSGIKSMQAALKTNQEKARGAAQELASSAETIKASAAENMRVKIALDNSSTNTMIADSDNNIVYMNKSLQTMMADAEQDIKKGLPGFQSSRLMGANMDQFHKKPAHQKSMISQLKSTFATEIVVGGRTFSLIANPVVDQSGKRLGTVVEWSDRTQEVMVETEVSTMVAAASRGDFKQTLSLEGKQGFFKNLAQGLNQLMKVTNDGMSDVARVLAALSKGDLTQTITADYEGLFLQLKQDTNATVAKLEEVIANIIEASNSVSSGANEIASGNTDLSQRTEEQASSLEETASSMEQMTGTVQQTSEHSQHANQKAVDAVSRAEAGGKVVQRAVAAMAEINESSKQIGDIIGVIDEIAFQTNLLALNAAVEAARAGEQGRGFAVVAGEVRNLAQRSAGAAKEIKELIRDSIDKVSNGSELVNHSGKTLTEIVSAVKEVTAMIADINVAAKEQSSSITQINQAVSEMDEMTQQNAALVEEATAAGQAMADQARSLMSLVGFFKLKHGNH